PAAPRNLRLYPGLPGKLRRRDPSFHRLPLQRGSVRDRYRGQHRDAAPGRGVLPGGRCAMTETSAPVGLDKAALDTPALLVDLDVMEANIARIAGECRQHGVNWRPHIKGLKTIPLIRRELAAGARGVTWAKLGEAEIMAEAGIRDILIANQVVGAIKAQRLADLLTRADPIVAVDSLANANELGEAAEERGRVLPVVIEVDIGM